MNFIKQKKFDNLTVSKSWFLILLKGLHTLGTVIIDYKGFRVTAQSIIPGILEREQEQSVVYGSIDFGKTIVTNEEYDSLLEKVAKATRQQIQMVKNQDGEEKKMYTSVETKVHIFNRVFLLRTRAKSEIWMMFFIKNRLLTTRFLNRTDTIGYSLHC